MPVQNSEIAAMFDQLADLLEVSGENPFRARAYRRAARTVDSLPRNVGAMIAEGQALSELPGIGKDLAARIAAIVKTGHFDVLDRFAQAMPGDVGKMVALPGLGPKRVKLLCDTLHIRTLDDLRRAVKAGQLRDVRGLGAAVQSKLAKALEQPVAEQRFKLSVAEEEAEALAAHLRGNGRVVIAGSYRRRRDTVGDLDILVTSAHGAAVGDRLIAYENVAEVLAHGPSRTTVVLRSGLQVDARAVPGESYGAALLYFTGSKAHNIALRALASRQGWKLNEYGLFDQDSARIAGATEEGVYEALGMAYIPPEMREDRGEIALAQSRSLPRLVALEDLRGDLHVHSDWTDGTAGIAEMAAAARARGYAYMALTDHSRRVAMAHGLRPADVARQIREIDALNASFSGFRILKGIEVDILKDGSLDLPDSILARLDLVVAAVHSFLDLPREAQTERVLRAMRHPYVSILAHPTARLIGEREPCALDMDRITSAAAHSGCILEMNAQPGRLDLNDVHAHMARSKGARLAISSDAHSVHDFACMRFGVDQARRAWLTAADVVNTRSLDALLPLLRRRHGPAPVETRGTRQRRAA